MLCENHASFFLIVSCLIPFQAALSWLALRQQDMNSASNWRNLCHLRAVSALLDGLNFTELCNQGCRQLWAHEDYQCSEKLAQCRQICGV
jgi:hypothetical protein